MFFRLKIKTKMQRFFSEHAVFILQMARISCPETSEPNTNLRHVTSKKSEILKYAPLALPGSTFGKSQALFEQNTERSYQYLIFRDCETYICVS
jgi:hypothetical protein